MIYNDKIKGRKTATIFYPIIILIIIFQAIIVVNSIISNVNTKRVSKESKRQSDINYDLTCMLASTSKLSDISINFCHDPVIKLSEDSYRLNTESLVIYYDEIIIMETDTKKIIENIEKYSISDEAMQGVIKLVDSFSLLLNYHSRAFALTNYALRNDNVKDIEMLQNILSYLGKYDLTEEELLYSKEEAIKVGFDSLFTMEYAVNKGNLSIFVDEIMNQIILDSSSRLDKNHNIITACRYIQWYSVASILLMTILFFILLIKNIIRPIIIFSKKISRNEKLDLDGKIYETNILAFAYNELLDRHIEYEKKLIDVAEKDSLTGLPNRYSYNEFLKKNIIDSNEICVFMFDLNDLKYVNDTFGHSEGDKLIKNASLCIKEVFSNGNCYRIGGDEFLAILPGVKEIEIKNYIENFESKQKNYNVSFAVGYAYTDDIKSIGYEELSKIADEMMYENKRKYKESKKLLRI